MWHWSTYIARRPKAIYECRLIVIKDLSQNKCFPPPWLISAFSRGLSFVSCSASVSGTNVRSIFHQYSSVIIASSISRWVDTCVEQVVSKAFIGSTRVVDTRRLWLWTLVISGGKHLSLVPWNLMSTWQTHLLLFWRVGAVSRCIALPRNVSEEWDWVTEARCHWK